MQGRGPRRSRRIAHAAFAATLAALAGGVHADDAVGVITARPGSLQLRTGEVRLAELPDLLRAATTFDAGTFDASERYVIELDGPLSAERRAALAAAGVRDLGYLPTNSLIADLSGSTGAKLRGLGFVTRVVRYEDAWRVDPVLFAGPNHFNWSTPERQDIAARGNVLARLWLFAGERMEPARDRIGPIAAAQIRGMEPVDGRWSFVVEMPAAAVAQLESWKDLQYAEPIPEYAARSNTAVRAMVQSGVTGLTPLYDRRLEGEGQIIGVIDGWVSTTHCAFRDLVNPIGPTHRKILAYNTFVSYDLHGTHVAATALGDAGIADNNRGVAYKAKLVFNTWPDPSEASVFGKLDLHRSQGAFVHNNSWGADFFTAYDGACVAIDTLSFNNDDNLVVFSVSNMSVIGNPENAKNCLAVAASGASTAPETMCSGGAGPTADGRRKPEVTAPGCNTSSSAGDGGCGTTPQSGTSMAAPAVSGVATLIREYFVDGYYPGGVANPADAFTPSGPLLKATIANSASDLTSVTGYPGTREGWGRVIADRALYFPGDTRKLVVRDVRNASPDALSTGDDDVILIENASASQDLRVTLAWHDRAAQVNASFTPVNDLNLVLTAPNGDVYYGNNFAGGYSSRNGTPDSINNLEQVHIAAPAAGRWTVRIVGNAVNAGPQGYAVVVTGDVTPGAPCLADFDQSGGVDGDDVTAFFEAWQQGLPEADVDQSGGIDGDDIPVFFAAWQAGC